MYIVWYFFYDYMIDILCVVYFVRKMTCTFEFVFIVLFILLIFSVYVVFLNVFCICFGLNFFKFFFCFVLL